MSNLGNNPDESLRLAKELISKDMADTQSWTNLGNAYMSYFFASSLDREDLFRSLPSTPPARGLKACRLKYVQSRALKAYHRSDLDGQSQDPDLHFNKGTVYRYLEDYPNAVLELLRADQLDKDLNAAEQVYCTCCCLRLHVFTYGSTCVYVSCVCVCARARACVR